MRVAILVAGMLLFLVIGFLGWLDPWFEKPLGIAFGWAYVLLLFGWMIFGVSVPALEYLSQQDHPVARALTFGYRLLKAYRRK